ncbi:hypothetical protein HK102_005522 [Quaeritorhiza haematococci]|nr:hypothetical protein HK102_005522 [Quaeritorhiza haematococci]
MRCSDQLSTLDEDLRRVLPTLPARVRGLEDIKGFLAVSGLDLIEGQSYLLLTEAGPRIGRSDEFTQLQQAVQERQKLEQERQQGDDERWRERLQQFETQLEILRSRIRTETKEPFEKPVPNEYEQEAEEFRQLLAELESW